jgi:predicted HAD superfamily Cof-like phosphohydrolase
MKPSPAEQRYELVTEFHDAFKVQAPRQWADASNATALARRTLHDEEFKEYMAADDDIDMLDALVDMEYIACGTQHLLALKQPRFDHTHTLYFCQQRVMDELNKSQLCQSGLTTALGILRAGLALIADNNDYDLHGAFLHIHETNMNKLWKKGQIDSIPPSAVVEPTADGFYVVKRADGKILKPPGWLPPKLTRYV